jgi:hypothetical protein
VPEEVAAEVTTAGRKPKLNRDRFVTIIEAVMRGHFFETAAALAGIHVTTFRDWIKRGVDAAAHGKRNRYVAFVKALREAEAFAEDVALRRIEAAEGSDWRAVAWRIARRHPKRWGDSSTVKLKGDKEEPLQVEARGEVIVDARVSSYRGVLEEFAAKQSEDAAAGCNSSEPVHPDDADDEAS